MLFFDLDGTLVDQDHIRLTSLRVVRRVHAPDCDEDRLLSQHDRVLEELVQQQRVKPLSLRDSGVLRFRRLAQEILGRPVCEEEATRWYETYRAAHERALRPVEGCTQLLHGLRACGFRLGVITNGYLQEQMHKLDVLGLRSLFDVVVVSEAVGMHKPEPGIFLLAARLAGVRAAHCTMIGDSLSTDIHGCIHAGLRGVFFGSRAQEPLPAGVLWLESYVPHAHCMDRLTSFLFHGDVQPPC